jgi:hypothetical protein
MARFARYDPDNGYFVCIAASAENGDAEKLLKGMADYVSSQKTLAVTYDSDIEVITSAPDRCN